MYLFKSVVFNCKRATLLSLKREEGRISFAERLELSYHLLYCDPCRRFIRQSGHLNQIGRNSAQWMEDRPPFSLEAASRARIQKVLDSHK